MGTNGLNQGRKTNLTHCRTLYHTAPIRPTSEKGVSCPAGVHIDASRLKKVLKIIFDRLFFLCIEMVWKKKKNLENIQRKIIQSALKSHPGGGQETLF